MNRRLRLRTHKPLIILSGLLIFVATSAIGQAGWTKHLPVMSSIGLFSFVIGLLISRSLLPTLIAHLFSLIIGFAWSFWIVSGLLPTEFTWQMRWENLMERTGIWFNAAATGGISYDNLMFVMQMALIVWLASYLSVWFLFRSGRIWTSILPIGFILFIVFHYAPKDLTTWVFVFILLSLLLIMMFNLNEHEQRWRDNRVYFRSDISYDFLREGIIFSVVVLSLAWLAPSVDSDKANMFFSVLDREWRSVQGEWNRLFADLNYKPDPYAYADTFGQSLTLGGARNLTPEPVLRVDARAGRYWRAVVFDEYDGLGWKSNDLIVVDLDAGEQPDAHPFFHARQPYTQTFSFINNGATVLYAMSNPVTADRDIRAKSSIVQQKDVDISLYSYWAGKKKPWMDELTYIQSDRRLRAEETYQVVSLLSIASIEQLQADDSPYPAWIQNRYLGLPAGIPQRVFDLAAEIARDSDNAFDKASAIEAYLRLNLTYNEGIALPPENRDKVDYILFDLKEAYCDYYATSMIVMLRSLGIPARMAAGYAGGEWVTLETGEELRVVQNKDAHSWVEVFFPRYGWIEFEPTSAQPIVARLSRPDQNGENLPLPDAGQEPPFDPLDDVENVDLGEGEGLGTNEFFKFTLPFWGEVQAAKETIVGLIIGGVLLLLVIGGWVVYGRYRLSRREASGELPTVSAIYAAMLKLAAWMGLKKHPSQTPYEHARILSATIPTVKPEVDLITAEFVQQNYSRSHTSTQEVKSALFTAWNDIRPQLYKAVFELRNPFRNWRLPFKW